MAEVVVDRKAQQKKWWLIGCGGCLGLIILVAILIAVMTGVGMNYLTQTSNNTVKELFGASYKPPVNYTVIGFPLKEKEIQGMVLLIDAQRGIMIFAVDTLVPDEASRVLKSGTPQQVEAFIKRIGAAASHSSGGGKTSVDVSDLRFESVHFAKLGNGKKLPVSNVKVYARRKGTYGPAVVALLPEAKSHVLVLMGMDPRNTSTDPHANFTVAQKALEIELLQLINNSELDNRLQ